jgi:3'-phosphoadenosine 5'-phosphosulfate sulfotransferase (PAPS reductase)/FAD synthetase
MSAFTKDDLKRFQAESLHQKFQRSLAKVAEWFARWNNEVYVSFSGGKDSTVLADICAKWCKVIGKPLYLVFVNTGLEYPEIQRFVKEYAQYLRDKYDIEVVLEILRPKMRFDEVIKKYGYPIISKDVSQAIFDARTQARKEGVDVRQTRLYNRGFNPESDYCKKYPSYCRARYDSLFDTSFGISHRCCDEMKKKPSKQYEKTTGRKPILATMTSESRLRQTKWLQYGCNAFDAKRPNSAPMSFWTEQDVFQYIKEEQLPIASVYGEIVYAEDPEQMRFEDYGIDCGGKEKLRTTGCDRTGCIFCAFGCHLQKTSNFQRLKQTHPRQYEYCIGGGEYDENGVWKPNKQGLGMGHVFDELNKIYGEDFIKY